MIVADPPTNHFEDPPEGPPLPVHPLLQKGVSEICNICGKTWAYSEGHAHESHHAALYEAEALAARWKGERDILHTEAHQLREEIGRLQRKGGEVSYPNRDWTRRVLSNPASAISVMVNGAAFVLEIGERLVVEKARHVLQESGYGSVQRVGAVPGKDAGIDVWVPDSSYAPAVHDCQAGNIYIGADGLQTCAVCGTKYPPYRADAKGGGA